MATISKRCSYSHLLLAAMMMLSLVSGVTQHMTDWLDQHHYCSFHWQGIALSHYAMSHASYLPFLATAAAAAAVVQVNPSQASAALAVQQLMGSESNTASCFSDAQFEAVENGLYCDADGLVTKLFYDTAQADGSLPSSLGNLTSLNHFYLNKITGLQGSLPPSFEMLTGLTTLSLSEVEGLQGSLPSSLTSMQQLQQLVLQSVFLSGPLAPIFQLTALRKIVANDALLYGSVPDSVSTLTALSLLSLSGISLSGPLPPAFFSLPALVSLELTDLKLNSSLPAGFSQLTSLAYLTLSNNSITGVLPSGLSSLIGLQYLVISDNSLSGPIPALLSSLSLLSLLDLTSNRLSGTIPSWLASLSQLKELHLLKNGLTGTIPPSLAFSPSIVTATIPSSVSCPPSYSICLGTIPAYNFMNSRCPSFCTTCNISAPPPSPPPLPPPFSPPPPAASPPTQSSSVSVAAIAGIAAAAAAIILVAVALFFYCQPGPDKTLWTTAGVRRIHIREVLSATNNFSEENVLGEGVSAMVYRGLSSRGVPWAVKRAKQERDMDVAREVTTISRVSHRFLIRLLGYCVKGKEQILIYELAENGNLRANMRKGHLSLLQRTQVALGIAQAVAYLHRNKMIHRDIKPENVLLTADFEPKLSDFGLVKEAVHMDGTMVGIEGTPGYMDPSMGSIVSDKFDVYSFGVVLLELLTNLPPADVVNNTPVHLRNIVREARENDKVLDIADASLVSKGPRDLILQLFDIALSCVEESPSTRPNMDVVVVELEKVESALAPAKPLSSSTMSSIPSTISRKSYFSFSGSVKTNGLDDELANITPDHIRQRESLGAIP